VDPLRRQTGMPRAEVIDAMIGHFRGRYGLTDDRITTAELRAAEKRAAEKFGTDEWTARVP
jgi:lipoate---protein ligase